MDNLDLAKEEQSDEISQLKGKIDRLRLGRRVLMNLLLLQEQQKQAQLREYELTISTLRRRNAELKQMLYCRKKVL